jgi:hypothetical protein
MLKLDPIAKGFDKLEAILLGDLGLKKRGHPQESIVNSPDTFLNEIEEEILILGTEVQPSKDVDGRIDILTVDPDGTLVIVELKRGANKWQLLQALSYAAMVSGWGRGPDALKDRCPCGRRLNEFVLSADRLNLTQRVVTIAEAYD